MFNNLIESSSHAREFKRRGSFVLFTTAIYAVLFVVAGVASIYAYDARLDDQNTEVLVMLNPLDLPAAPATPVHATPNLGRDHGRSGDVVRENPMASVNHPEKVPEHASAVANISLPVPDRGRWKFGEHDGPLEPRGNGRSGGDGTGPGNGDSTLVVDVGAPPPPAPTPTPKKIVKSLGVINGLAISLPKPAYPLIGKQARAQGPVNVQVLIDEMGRVISARAVSGHPLLMHAAQEAALAARFSPTKLGEQAVKVSGVITYNFVLQ
jgi:TonB family protein